MAAFNPSTTGRFSLARDTLIRSNSNSATLASRFSINLPMGVLVSKFSLLKHMLPTKWSDVFKEFIRNFFAITAELFHCSTEIHSIPEGDGGYREIETRSAVALIFKGSISQLSMAVKEQRPGQGITGFSFVENGI